MAILKVDEWSDACGNWLVADVKTWARWYDLANVLGVPALDEFTQLLREKYKARIHRLVEADGKVMLIIFDWPPSSYSYAHKFKLDVNRLARKQSYEVEKPF